MAAPSKAKTRGQLNISNQLLRKAKATAALKEYCTPSQSLAISTSIKTTQSKSLDDAIKYLENKFSEKADTAKRELEMKLDAKFQALNNTSEKCLDCLDRLCNAFATKARERKMAKLSKSEEVQTEPGEDFQGNRSLAIAQGTPLNDCTTPLRTTSLVADDFTPPSCHSRQVSFL